MEKGHEVRVVSAVCLQLEWHVSCTPDVFVTRMSHFDSQTVGINEAVICAVLCTNLPV
jgi:hypothetical protein